MKALWAVLAVISFANFSYAKGILDNIDGDWKYEVQETWEFRNPGKEFTNSEHRFFSHLSGIGLRFDVEKNIFTSFTPGKQREVTIFTVIQEDVDRVKLKIGNRVEVFEIKKNGSLLVYPAGDATQGMIFSRGKNQTVTYVSPTNPPTMQTYSVHIEHVLAQLADSGGRRFIRISIEAVCKNSDDKSSMINNMLKARDAVGLLLQTKTYAELSSYESKKFLKDELAAAINKALSPKEPIEIYFTDMSIQ